MSDVLLLTGAGQIGLSITRRVGAGKTIVIGDRSLAHAQAAADTLTQVGFEALPLEMDLSSRASIQGMLETAQGLGPSTMLVNAAGVSPAKASMETILAVDLYGTAVLLEEVGKVIAPGGWGDHLQPVRPPHAPADPGGGLPPGLHPPTEELLSLDLLQPANLRDTLHAYQMAKRCNEKRVMAEAVRWEERGARLNSISPASL